MDRTKIADAVSSIESRVVTDEPRYESGEYETFADVVAPSAKEALEVGAGYLVLDECSRAKEWFGDSASGWVWRFNAGVEMRLEKDRPINGLKWRDGQNAIKTAVLSGSEEVLSETIAGVQAVIETIPADLLGDEQEMTYALLLLTLAADATDADVSAHESPAALLDRFAASDGVDDTERKIRLFDTQLATVRGLVTADVDQATDGIEDRLAFHQIRVVDRADNPMAPFEVSDIELELCLEAIELIALARHLGLDVTVDSEYVPELVNSASCYPLGARPAGI